MISQQVEVREYTSPSIYVYPDAIMCENEVITLNAIYFGTSDLIWLNPLNSTLSSIDVNQPGTYVCEITQCGITVLDSVIIIDGNFEILDVQAGIYNLIL